MSTKNKATISKPYNQEIFCKIKEINNLLEDTFPDY